MKNKSNANWVIYHIVNFRSFIIIGLLPTNHNLRTISKRFDIKTSLIGLVAFEPIRLVVPFGAIKKVVISGKHGAQRSGVSCSISCSFGVVAVSGCKTVQRLVTIWKNYTAFR